jgi:hypothetical protein
VQMQHNDPGFGPRGFLANWAPHILGKNPSAPMITC